MTRLSDTQAVLLSTAAARDDGSLLPLPASLKPGGGAAKALAALLARGFAEERETSDPALTYRTDDEERRFGLFLTAAGAAAIGVTPVAAGGEEAGAADAADTASVPSVSPTARPRRKAALVLDLLRRPQGATTAELIEATGWLPHTTRAALTGLRRKGHAITRGKRGEVTCYSVKAAA